jgi:hypothetical protein
MCESENIPAAPRASIRQPRSLVGAPWVCALACLASHCALYSGDEPASQDTTFSTVAHELRAEHTVQHATGAREWKLSQIPGEQSDTGKFPQILLSPSGYGALIWDRLEPKFPPIYASIMSPDGTWIAPTQRGAAENRAFSINDLGHVVLISSQRAYFFVEWYNNRWTSSRLVDYPTLHWLYDACLTADDRALLVYQEQSEDPVKSRPLSVGVVKLGELIVSERLTTGLDAGGYAEIKEFGEGSLLLLKGGASHRVTVCPGCDAHIWTLGNHIGRTLIAVDSSKQAATLLWDNLDGPKTTLWAGQIVWGGQWSGPTRVSDAMNNVYSPQIAIDGHGVAHAVWLEGEDKIGRVMTARRDPATGLWSKPEVLSPASDASCNAPALAVDPSGNGLALWVHLDLQTDKWNPGGELHWAQYTPGQGWSTRATALSTAGAVARYATIAMDASGRASAAWTENERLRVARYE